MHLRCQNFRERVSRNRVESVGRLETGHPEDLPVKLKAPPENVEGSLQVEVLTESGGQLGSQVRPVEPGHLIP